MRPHDRLPHPPIRSTQSLAKTLRMVNFEQTNGAIRGKFEFDRKRSRELEAAGMVTPGGSHSSSFPSEEKSGQPEEVSCTRLIPLQRISVTHLRMKQILAARAADGGVQDCEVSQMKSGTTSMSSLL